MSEATPPTAVSDEPVPTSVLRSVLELAWSRGLLLGFSLISNLLSARFLGPSGRGELALALQASYLVGFLALFGLDRSLSMVAPGLPASIALPTGRQMMRRRSAVIVATGATLTVVGSVVDANRAFTFAVVVAAMGVVNGHLRLIEVAFINQDRTRWMARVQLLNGGLTLTLLVALMITSNTESLAWFGAYSIASLATMTVITRTYGVGLSARSTPLPAAWSRAGRRLLPASLAGFATLRSDRLLLAAFSGTAELGIYAVVATLVDVASVPFEALGNVFLPRWRTAASGARLRVRRPLALAGGASVLVAAGVWAVGTLLIEPLLGAEYTRGVGWLPILCVASVLFAWSRLAQTRALALGLDALVSWAETIGLAAGGASYVLLIPAYGGLGAALGSVLGYGSSLSVVAFGQWQFDRRLCRRR